MNIPLEDQLYTILSPTFGTEIYPVVHPDPDGELGSVSDIYAVYSVIGGSKNTTLETTVELTRVRVQISIYGTDYTEFKTKQRAVEAAMIAANLVASNLAALNQEPFEVAGALANVEISQPSEGFESDTKRFFTHTEFYCWSR